MGRKLRTTLPQVKKCLIPKWGYLGEFREKNGKFKESQRRNFNKSHRAQDLPPIPDDTDVWITSEDQTIRGRVVKAAGAPRSYVVETPAGQVHRNRQHLNVVPQAEGDQGGGDSHSQGGSPELSPPTPIRPQLTIEHRSPKVIMTQSRTAAKLASSKKGDMA